MKIKALKSFCGTVTMGIGDIKDVDESMALGLIGAGYAQPVEEKAETLKETVPPEAAKADEEKTPPDEAAPPAETEQPPKKSAKKVTKNETK